MPYIRTSGGKNQKKTLPKNHGGLELENPRNFKVFRYIFEANTWSLEVCDTVTGCHRGYILYSYGGYNI